MKPRCSTKRNVAITLLEIGVVIVVLAILTAVVLPFLATTKRTSSRIGCVQNLKQIGLAYRIWSGDNNDFFPMGISVTNGGSLEAVRMGDVATTFQVMSNELSTPKILVCRGDGIERGDTNRMPATDFSKVSNSNISYFVGVDVTNDANPLLIISGDSNLQLGGKTAKSGLLLVGTSHRVAWDSGRHVYYGYNGNLGFADGSVQSLTISGLRSSFVQTGLATNRLAIP
jgi:type II secretory pathway pseudopilin PulG